MALVYSAHHGQHYTTSAATNAQTCDGFTNLLQF